MGEQNNTLKDRLEKAVEMIDNGILDVVNDLGFEEDNLEDLVPSGDTATREHLTHLKELLRGLQNRLSDLRGELVGARQIAGDLDDIEDGETADGDEDSGEAVEMEAREASKLRHDEPISLGVILRSLLMANEPGQRERAKSDDDSA